MTISKLIKPITVNDASLVSSTVYETAPAAWSSGTTYALNADASVASAGGLVTIYRSLQASNTNHAPASSPTWWKVLSTTYAAYSGGATYALEDRVINATDHQVYESLVGGNVGNPLSDTTKWIAIGPTNKWAPFDQRIGSLASRADSMSYVLAVGMATAVAILEAEAATVFVNMTDGSGGPVVFDREISMDITPILDAWDYCFAPFELRTDLAVTDLPPYENGVLTITLVGSGMVSCGVIVVGDVYELGMPQYGAELGILDFSAKETDKYGLTDIVERGFARRMDLQLISEPAALTRLYRLLASVRATPCVYIGVDEAGFEPTLVYGFPRDFRIVISYPSYHLCSLQVEGLSDS